MSSFPRSASWKNPTGLFRGYPSVARVASRCGSGTPYAGHAVRVQRPPSGIPRTVPRPRGHKL
jgi:hypothetical protein